MAKKTTFASLPADFDVEAFEAWVDEVAHAEFRADDAREQEMLAQAEARELADLTIPFGG